MALRGRMNVRGALTILISSALVLAVAAPTAHAAKAPVQPSGQALVRIDGGTAYTKDLGKGKYRVFVPDGASIMWLGEVGTKGTHSGTFTPKALVAGWARLGQREGAKALTTLTWGEGAGDVSTLALLAKPRINADGQLTFVTRPVGWSLPKQMVDFSINIARADMGNGPATRDWSTTFKAWEIDATAFVQATVTNNTTATVSFYPSSGYTPNPCRTTITLSTTSALQVNFPGFTCGDLTVNGKVADNSSISSFVKLYPATSSTNPTPGYVKAKFSVTPSVGGSVPFDLNIAQWSGPGGSNPTPLPTPTSS